jgi:hypothetical protein
MEEIQNENQEEKSSPEPAPERGGKRMPLGKKIFWGIVIVILIVVAIQVVLADKYKATVLVIEGEKKVGVNPTTEVLDFGDLSKDTQATRTVALKSGGGDTYIWIMKFGKLSELIKLDDSRFVLKGGQEKKIEFSVYMPNSATIGERMNASVWIVKLPKIW